MYYRALAAALLSLVLLTMPDARASELEQHLRAQYQGKTLVVRGFYSGGLLRYDPQGTPSGAVTSGDWTLDGFVHVDALHVSHRNLQIKATRAVVFSAGKGFQIREQDQQPEKKDKKPILVEIEAVLGEGSISTEQADAVLSKIFLTSQDNFADLLPDFWKPCIAGGVAGRNESCSFSPEMASIPGIPTPSGSPDLSSATSANATPRKLGRAGAAVPGAFRMGSGVKPPRVFFSPEPPFSELSRKARYQGVVVLGLIVNREGLPTNIRVVSPLGCGLDANAVQAVKTWKFKPAEKDGQPVDFEIAVEVDFHLY